MKKENNLLQNSISGLKFGILQQLISRILTFILNVLIVRAVSAEILGIANVQFQLIMNTILFLTRECFRRASIRTKYEKSSMEETKKTITFSYFTIPLGIAGCYVVSKFFENTMSLEEKNTKDYLKSMNLTIFATMIEILSEPMFILAQNLMFSKLRFFMESFSVLLRCIVTYLCVGYFDLGLNSFSYGQIAYAFSLFIGYYCYFIYFVLSGRSKEYNLNFLSDLIPNFKFFSEISSKFRILIVFWLQSVLKLVLGEGEKYVLKFKESLLDQGVYSIVNNLASLIARILFAPIEEIAHTYFAKLVDSTTIKDHPHFSNDKIDTALDVYNSLVKLMIFFGMYLAAFGPPFSFFLLNFLYTSKVSSTDAPLVLSVYCFYIFTIAVNGVTEAFVHAVGTPSELNFFNLLMLFFSTVYIVSAIFLISYFKTVGLIVSNCINMTLRIIFSLFYTFRFFKKNFDILKQTNKWNWRQILPKNIILFLFFIIFVLCKFIERNTCSKDLIGNGSVLNLSCFTHLGFGGLCFLVSVTAIYYFEKEWLSKLFKIWKMKND